MGLIDNKLIKVAICVSKFNYEHVSNLEKSTFSKLVESGINKENIDVFYVPGALELPIILAECCKAERYDGLIAVGAIIRGETYHFEVVSDQSAFAIMNVQLKYGIPIMNAVLTTNNDEETSNRTVIKGHEAAEGLLQTIATLKKVNQD